MRLKDELLIECEEFFELIPIEDEDSELNEAILSLRELLEHNADGWASFSNEKLIEIVQSRVREIWSFIPKEEKNSNPNLCDYYESLRGYLDEEESEYEFEDDSKDDDEDWGEDE